MELLGRYRNGNYSVTLLSDGTKIRETQEDVFVPAFAENMDIKLTNRCDMGCKFCHEGSTPDGKHGNILNERFIDTLKPYQEVALGGGNILGHPDLIPFLEKLKEKRVIANITVNQIHFEQNYWLIRKLAQKELIYGLGVSLVNPTEIFINRVSAFPNAVIHTINGILKPEDIKALENKGLKILILGYKHLRRGIDYLAKEQEKIKQNQAWLKENLEDIFSKFEVVSFDNLALEQLDVKSLMSKEDWDEFYMGNDGDFTFYIDMVERKFAKSSTAPFDKRYDLLDSVGEMFKVVTSE